MSLARAHIPVDRPYFEALYDDWLAHRSRWRRYALPYAAATTLAGAIGLAWPLFPLVAAILLVFGIYRIYEAVTHRRKWIAERLRDLPGDKTLDITFHPDHIATETPNSSGTLKFGALRDVIATPTGLFLCPQTGVSIYVPKAAIEPAEMVPTVVEVLQGGVAAAASARSH